MAVPVDITKREVLRPSPALAIGACMKSPLTVFDRAAMDLYVPSIYAWSADAGGAEAPSNDNIKNGLAAVLARFPHLPGRFAVDERGWRCFDLNDAGVLVLEATASASLADALAHDVPAHINELYPKADKERADEPLLQVQLTRYTCGGLVIGVTAHHHVADGQSMSVFFVAWAAAVRTRGTLLPTPFLYREGVVVPSRLPQPVFNHRNIEFDGERSSRSNSYGALPLHRIGNLAVHFPEEFVARLKARVGTRCQHVQMPPGARVEEDHGGAGPLAGGVHAGQDRGELPRPC